MARIIQTVILCCLSVFTTCSVSAQDRIADMPAPTLLCEPSVVEGNLPGYGSDTVRLFVFDPLDKDGFPMIQQSDSTGHFHFNFLCGSTAAATLTFRNSEAYILTEPGDTIRITLRGNSGNDTYQQWTFSGPHSQWNNDMNRLPRNCRFEWLYDEIVSRWNRWTEDGDEFKFKEEVVRMQAQLERRIKDSDVCDKVKTFNYLTSKLYFLELLSGYAFTLNENYMRRGMDRSVSRDFYREAVTGDFLRFNSLIYSPLCFRMPHYKDLSNRERGARFTLPSFFERTAAARRCLALISDGQNVNDRQLENIREKTPELSKLVEQRNEELRERKREQLRNPMYQIRYIDEDLNGKHILKTISDMFPGRVLVIDFWATWCMPCRMANESIKPLKEEFRDSVTFIHVTGETSSEETWRQLIPDIRGYHFYLTDFQWTELCKKFKIHSIPSFFIISPDGNIAAQYSGYPGNDALREVIRKLQVKESKEAASPVIPADESEDSPSS